MPRQKGGGVEFFFCACCQLGLLASRVCVVPPCSTSLLLMPGRHILAFILVSTAPSSVWWLSDRWLFAGFAFHFPPLVHSLWSNICPRLPPTPSVGAVVRASAVPVWYISHGHFLFPLASRRCVRMEAVSTSLLLRGTSVTVHHHTRRFDLYRYVYQPFWLRVLEQSRHVSAVSKRAINVAVSCCSVDCCDRTQPTAL